MVNQLCPLLSLNRDLMGDIMHRLDGTTVAVAASVCSDLRALAKDQELWRKLCYSLWPSTAIHEMGSFVSDFNKLYKESYPLIHHEKPNGNIVALTERREEAKTCTHPRDFVSMVDVYYNNKCILSKGTVGIAEAGDNDEESSSSQWDANVNQRKKWFSSCPFSMDILRFQDCNHTTNSYINQAEDYEAHDDHGIRNPPSESNHEDMNQSDTCNELENGLRLSWILLDKKGGKSVNLSSWRPILLQTSWPRDNHYQVHFGCIVPVEESILPSKLARCIIRVRGRFLYGGGHLEIHEISMHIEDLDGTHTNGQQSMMVLDRALYCSTSTNQCKVKKGFIQYERQKKEMMKQRQFRETILISLHTLMEIAVCLLLFHIFSLQFQHIFFR